MDNTQATVNRKTKYYHAHKEEPEFQNRLKTAKKKYYEANKERLIEKALERYYRIKAMIHGDDTTVTVHEI